MLKTDMKTKGGNGIQIAPTSLTKDRIARRVVIED